jgi:hypothetical protein
MREDKMVHREEGEGRREEWRVHGEEGEEDVGGTPEVGCRPEGDSPVTWLCHIEYSSLSSLVQSLGRNRRRPMEKAT